ncbi:MAG TPA: hypothetical protein VGH33_14260, partial [Isosphaeraceae bacterium]
WLHHALRLPGLRRVFHCGGERDFDNGYCSLAPWSQIRRGRVVVFPARRRFTRGRWSRLPVHPLLVDGVSAADVLHDALRPFRHELDEVPLYVSIDKDVLVADDAVVNWESGLLRLDEAVAVVEAFVRGAGGRLAGADLLGDWSPVRLDHWLSRLCDRIDRPSVNHDPAEAAALNRRANAALLRALLSGSRAGGAAAVGPTVDVGVAGVGLPIPVRGTHEDRGSQANPCHPDAPMTTAP